MNGISVSGPRIPDDIANSDDCGLVKLRNYAASLPYSIESNAEMQRQLDLILSRLVQAVKSRDYDYGLLQWDSIFASWLTLKYPLPKDKRIALAKLYYEVCVLPGMQMDVVSSCMDTLSMLVRSKRKLSINDLRLPWKPVYRLLKKDLFLKRRQFEISQTTYQMGFVAETTRRFFHPACIDEMLQEFVPSIIGSNLDQILANQYYLVTFLPLSHPQYYLPMLFRVWESINSWSYDERMLGFLSKLAKMHVDPTVSDPKGIDEIPYDSGDPPPHVRWEKDDSDGPWPGLYNRVGIFSDDEWSIIMCKCLASMEIPLADAGSLTTGSSVDGQAAFEISRLPQCTWRIFSLARIIVYSMMPDGPPAPASGTPTPAMTPFSSGVATPHGASTNGKVADYLSAGLGSKFGRVKERKYIGGSKALDALSKLIISVESFFHPTNSGKWTSDLTAFVKYLVYEFNKRWHEEQKPDCKTPKSRRLTPLMRRELVRCLRTVALLAIFSSDDSTVSNVQSALKSMVIMEPDLILPSILERAVPSLEALTETQRTIAIMKALSSVGLGMVSRDIYYPGAKHLLPVLELLIPGIDLNDPTKTLCTTSFLVDVSQYIKFGDLTEFSATHINGRGSPMPPSSSFPSSRNGSTIRLQLPTLSIGNGFGEQEHDGEPRLSNEEEDALVRVSTCGFASFVTSLFHRVITLMENLPEEGQAGTRAGGADEVTIIDNIGSACSQICAHLSEPLFDLVLNLIFDYASNNVRPNAVRAIHQLVECVANADPKKTIARFLPFCIRSIEAEIEHGASSLRTTSMSEPLPSDATLHWNLAILRGAMFNDGTAILPYKQQIKDVLRLLLDKTFSKRGFAWTGRLLFSVLLSCTHTYPLENRWVNPEEWYSAEFVHSHHKYWGKLYAAGEAKVVWHVPNADEIAFAFEIFDELVVPTFDKLEALLGDDVARDATWRNDFCRHLSFVRDAFSGIASLAKEEATEEERKVYYATSDLAESLPEMIACGEPITCGFPLSNPDDPQFQKFIAYRRQFSDFLLRASKVLRNQGEENTVDAILMLLQSIRTYLFENGATNGEDYSTQREQYKEETSVARQHSLQKSWPRSVWVRRARFYQSARVRWVNLERIRTNIENEMIDELAEWSMYIYPAVRAQAQGVLESMMSYYDGLRSRLLPKIYTAMVPGVEDDRMKGALYLLNSPSLAKFALCEPAQASLFVERLFGCQHNEKPSIQNVVNTIAENCLANFIEPCFVAPNVPSERLDHSIEHLEGAIPKQFKDDELVRQNTKNCKRRTATMIKHTSEVIDKLLTIADDEDTHWRYEIVAIRALRTLIRRDQPPSAPQLEFFMEQALADNPSMRYYAQRAVMKTLRYIKLRTFSKSNEDIGIQMNRNPLRKTLPVQGLTHEKTQIYLSQFKEPIDWKQASKQPLLQEKATSGWLAWSETADWYLAPGEESPFEPWEVASQGAVETLREVLRDPEYWSKLKIHYSEENNSEIINQDNVSFVKSLFQMLGEDPLEHFKPVFMGLLEDIDENKQRGAAELLAGLIGGSKHWPMPAQQRLWAWVTPLIPKFLGSNVKTDTLMIWTSFLEYILGNKDPRRVQPIIDYLVKEVKQVDFNGESSFEPVRVCCFVHTLAEALGWRFSSWTDSFLDRFWVELASEHDEVRAYIADALQLYDKIRWKPHPTVPTVECVVRESKAQPLTLDLLGVRDVYHKEQFTKLIQQFVGWREQRLPGARAIHSTYDRAASTVMKWLFLGLHDLQAISTYEYLLPFIPELLRISELNDNPELSNRASFLLTRMCGVSPPRDLIGPILNALFEAIQQSPSWRIRLKALPLLQVFYFRQMPLISEIRVVQILEVVCKCLDDEIISVREMAATTLSGILRCSPRQTILTLKDRFVRLARKTKILPRGDPLYATSIRTLHSAILGIGALLDAYPYSVPHWAPKLITDVLSKHTHSPLPISTTVHQTAMNFKKTHQDTWHEDQKRFDEDGLSALSILLTGSSYYA